MEKRIRAGDRIVLLVLARFGSLAGFQIAQYLPWFYRLGIYVRLARMCDAGLLAMQRHTDPRMGFDVYRFTVTGKGISEMQAHRDIGELRPQGS